MNKLSILTLTALLLAPLAALHADEAAPRRPKHILWLMADQYIYDAFNFAGDRHVPTPNLDKLASQGTYLRQTYCQFPLCTPSRTSFTLGRYAHSTGVYQNGVVAPRDVMSFAQVLRRNGFITQVLGKLHITGRDDLDWNNPEAQFKQTPKQRRKVLNAKSGIFSGPLSDLEDWVWKDEMIAFLKKHAHERWFLECSFIVPHPPWVAPQQCWDRVNRALVEQTLRDINQRYPATKKTGSAKAAVPYVLDSIQAYYGNVSLVDVMVGEILSTLDQLGLREDTLVIFTSDHGEMLYRHRSWGKESFFDPSVRVPLIVAWPGVLPQGRTSEALVQMIDLYPTLLDVLGLEIPKSAQGKSLLPLLQGKTEKHWDEVYSELEGGKVMQFDGRYKWIDNGAGAPELYDMQNDPWEVRNLAALPEFREKTEAKVKELRQWRATDVAPQTPVGRSRKSARLKTE
ncbi:MAG: sulfatase-like hydrolase/transferase [Verrucomicrobia bacterium]|nr:sulfatase-like hydrolase/transferase [Verrucomicrobiota bacterium]